MALKKWNTNFRSVKKNKSTFSDVLLLREIFWWNDSKSRVPFTSQPDFSETFLHMVNKSAQRDFPYPFCAGTFPESLSLVCLTPNEENNFLEVVTFLHICVLRLSK